MPPGKHTPVAKASTSYHWEYWDNTKTKSEMVQGLLNTIHHRLSPRTASMDMRINWARMDEKPRRAWSYTPGQRRVKLSPEFAYDTPVASMGGVTLFDELFVFSGKMDRFDFKLVGKKEMFIQYNAYKNAYDCPVVETALKPQHVNPDCERWELHRVWVVEATLKTGMRHAYSKRMYYFDEDLTGAANYDAFDHNGQLYRAMFQAATPMYDKTIPYSAKNVTYDFNKGMYAYVNDVMVGGFKVPEKAQSERELNPEAIVARETAR